MIIIQEYEKKKNVNNIIQFIIDKQKTILK